MPQSPRLLRPASNFTPKSIAGLALWLDASDASSLYTTDAGAVAAVSAPTDISGCAIWLDGDQSVTTSVFDATSGGNAVAAGGAIARWQDKSGNGRHFIQSTPTLRPTLTTSGRNGRSVVTFDVTDDYMTSAATQSIAQPATWLFAYKVPSSIASSWSLVDSTTDRVHVYSAGGSTISQYTVGGSFVSEATGVTADQWRIGTYHFNGASSFGRRDGAQTASGTTGTNAINGSIMLGANNGASAVFRSQMAEAILLVGASVTDIARVEAYLAAKWGITGVHAQATATNDPVGYWADKSGNARHATQSTAGNRPGIGTAVSGGRRGVSFGTTANSQKLSWVPSSGTQDWQEVFAVGIYDTAASTFADNHSLFGGTTSSLSDIGWQGEQAQNAVSYIYGTFARRSNINAIDAVDTSLVKPFPAITSPFLVATRNTNNTLATGFQVGNDRTVANRNWRGRVGEVVAFSRALNSLERSRVARYLAAKWGITLAPRVSNADAQDWINRVYANGGSVTSSTAAAVNTLCIDLENASLRDRFYRLNLFCGTGLNAALVPLYRGPSLGGTQYGSTTDTNVGPFVSGDYSESAGLTAGLSSTKYLDTGLQTSSLPAGVIDSGHLSAWHGAISAVDTDPYFVAANNGSTDRAALQVSVRAASASVESCRYGKTTNVNASAGVTGARPAAFLLGQRTSATNLELWKNNSVVGTNATSTTGIAGIPYNFYVFSANNAGTRIGDQPGTTLRHYSIGDDMTPSQVGAFYNALSAFNASMGRV